VSHKLIKVWLVQRGICVRTLKVPPMTIVAVRMATNGAFIVTSEDGYIYRRTPSVYVQFPHDKKKYELSDYTEAVHALAISSDNLHIR